MAGGVIPGSVVRGFLSEKAIWGQKPECKERALRLQGKNHSGRGACVQEELGGVSVGEVA